MCAETEMFLGWVGDKADRYALAGQKKDFVVTIFRSGLRRHTLPCLHSKNVALLAEKVAEKLGKDTKAAFLGGLMHDTGKFSLPAELFDGRKIAAGEYEIVKYHAVFSHKILRGQLLFTSLVAGTHHSQGMGGYGMTTEDFPELKDETVKKIHGISSIVSVADYIDAAVARLDSRLMDGSRPKTIKDGLLEKYPAKLPVINASLQCAQELGWQVW
jgi:putative nucleotidyltransferase with HDIG domain